MDLIRHTTLEKEKRADLAQSGDHFPCFLVDSLLRIIKLEEGFDMLGVFFGSYRMQATCSHTVSVLLRKPEMRLVVQMQERIFFK